MTGVLEIRLQTPRKEKGRAGGSNRSLPLVSGTRTTLDTSADPQGPPSGGAQSVMQALGAGRATSGGSVSAGPTRLYRSLKGPSSEGEQINNFPYR